MANGKLQYGTARWSNHWEKICPDEKILLKRLQWDNLLTTKANVGDTTENFAWFKEGNHFYHNFGL